jgi:hypothetical protein
MAAACFPWVQRFFMNADQVGQDNMPMRLACRRHDCIFARSAKDLSVVRHVYGKQCTECNGEVRLLHGSSVGRKSNPDLHKAGLKDGLRLVTVG